MTISVSFLFDSSHADAPNAYGRRFDSAFLRALESADPHGVTASWVLRGDMLTHNLASKVVSVSQDSHTVGYDRDLLKTAIHDIWQWLSVPPSRFDSERLLDRMLRLSMFHCIALPTIELPIAQAVDEALTADPLYMGMALVDQHNPVLAKLLLDYLVRDAGIREGRVWLERSFEGDVNTPFEGGQQFSANGIGIVGEGELADKFGRVPGFVPSEAGDLISARYAKKGRMALQQRVLTLMTRDWELNNSGPFQFDALAAQPGLESSVPPEKLTRYALDPAHPQGGGKAKFFRDTLNITADDWRYLYAQIHEAIEDAPLTDLKMKRGAWGVGVSFNAMLAITGRNGRIASVFTNWIMRPGQKPQLATIRPDEQQQANTEAAEPPIVGSDLSGDARWQRLYDLAHHAGCEARDGEVPTPMFLEKYGGIADGLCGYAYVHVPDARRNFARWLVKNDRAYRGYRGGATISAPRVTQSVDCAFAYATAFARVLEYNGVECSTEKQLD